MGYVSPVVKKSFEERKEKVSRLIKNSGINYNKFGIFGSYARNDYTASSDIDFCLIVDEGEIAKEKFQNGIYKNLDPLKTNFKGCYFGVVYRVGSKVKKYPIYIGKERVKRLYDNINNGKIVI